MLSVMIADHYKDLLGVHREQSHLEEASSPEIRTYWLEIIFGREEVREYHKSEDTINIGPLDSNLFANKISIIKK